MSRRSITRVAWICALIYVAMLMGCSVGSRSWSGPSAIEWNYSILVENKTDGPIRVGDQYGTLGTVQMGEVRCFQLHTPSTNGYLWYKELAQGRHLTVPLEMSVYRHWHWVVGLNPIQNSISAVPSWGPCEPFSD